MRNEPRNRDRSSEHIKIAETIELLTSLNMLESDKVLILLAFAGEKPLGEISIPDTPHFQHEVDNTRTIFRRLGLKYHEEHSTNSGKPIVHFDFARDAQALEKVIELRMRRSSMSSEVWRMEQGKLYGFPDTAVHAFVTHQALLDDLPHHVRNTPLGKFYDRAVSMKLSEAHWPHEIKTIKQWMEAIHSVSPKYLEYILSDEWLSKGERH